MGRSVRACLTLGILVSALGLAGQARAMYLTDGAIETSPGVYSNPGDGVCVVGVAPDGTLDVNTSITNARDCAAFTTATIKAIGTQAACQGGAGGDGYKHAWSTSICVDNAISRNPISRVDLDNTATMCTSKGGVVYTGGLCIALGWQYMGVKAGETLPYRNTIVPAGYKGRTAADNLGFCYASMRMTSAPGYGANVNGGCPSFHNASATASPGEWVNGSDGVAYQTQTSYDAGLGWSFASSQCLYAYGTKGYLNAALTDATNATAIVPLCAGGTGAAAAGVCVDLTGIATMGDCLAVGGSWDNWLPTLGGIAPGAVDQTVVTAPFASTIKKLDATTLIAAGGGKFYSGTGSVCLKCHADQSRAYQERDKPGFVGTGHKLAGDTAAFATVGNAWGLKGVQCEICHATGKPTQQDLGVVVYGNATGTNAGLPRAASGHNQTEYGSHVTGVCYFCHGTPTVPDTGNPAAVIPVAGGDFAPTAKGLAPIANEFLNSPHAKYAGGARTIDVITRTGYASTFIGEICRTAATTVSGTWTSTTCPAAGHTWTTPPGASAAGCYWNATSCAAAGNTWSAIFDVNQYPVNNGGVCAGVGLGSIVTTVYRNGAAGKIPNLDLTTNAACTNAGDGSAASGAAAFVVREGEATGTANGVAFVSSDQGNCMTCHDVHWSLDSTDPEAEPIRRECTTCHSHAAAETSASAAPQIDLTVIKHLKSAGTPLANWTTDPDQSCEICHMPKSSGAVDASRMHLWRINTSAAYATMGATQANTAADGTYAAAAWVDIDRACGQCHGGGTSSATNPPLPGIPYYTKAQLAPVAAGMHSQAAVTYATTFSAAASGLTVTVTASVACGGVCPALTYDWDWGDGTTSLGVATASTSHTYATAGTKTIKLTVRLAADGKVAGSSTRTIAATALDLPPTANAVFVWDPNTWVLSVTDASTDTDATPVQRVMVDWGDGTLKSFGAPGATFAHTYIQPGTYAAILRAIDTGQLFSTTAPTVVSPAFFSIAGTVRNASGTGLSGATVQFRNAGGVLVKSVPTSGTGTYTTGATLKPGTYSLRVVKAGSTFPTAAITVGPSQSGVDFTALAPVLLSIAGSVRDPSGAALPGATVLFRNAGGVLVKSVRTTDTGAYTTGATLRAGTYSLKVVKTGYRFPAAVTTVRGRSRTGIDFTALTR